MKQKLAAFFRGRYGADAFSRGLLILYLTLAVLTLFIGNTVFGKILNLISVAVCVFMFYRMFSRQTAKRAEENRKYLLLVGKAKRKLLLHRNKWKYRKTHVYRECPHCHAQIRLPRVSGDHQCNCPKCRTPFDIRI